MLVWFNFKYYFEIVFALAKHYKPPIADLTMLILAEVNSIKIQIKFEPAPPERKKIILGPYRSLGQFDQSSIETTLKIF